MTVDKPSKSFRKLIIGGLGLRVLNGFLYSQYQRMEQTNFWKQCIEGWVMLSCIVYKGLSLWLW